KTTLYRWRDLNITGGGDPERVRGVGVSANYFELLGVKPLFGRAFLPEEEEVGHEQVAVLSRGLWERRFGADKNVIGRPVKLDGKDFTIVGVMDKDFDFPKSSEIFVPLALSPDEKNNRKSHYLHVVARLKQGVSASEANVEMKAIALRLAQDYPQTNRGWGVR